MEESRFGDLLRTLRLAANLSQEELAARAGLSTQAISALERGIRRAPYRHTLDALASALQLGPSDRVALSGAAQRRRATNAGPAIVEQPAPARSSPQAPPPSSPPGPTIPDAGLIGREIALAEIVALVRHAGARLLTLTGPGGVGKTRLTRAVAEILAPAFVDGATVVALADLRNPAQVPAEIGRALGLPNRASDPAATLRDHLRERQMLLLLDNFEQLLPAAPLVTDLLEACPQLVVLATSRAPLRLARERAYALPPLACPDPTRPIAPAALAAYGAPALFVARARAARPDFTLTPANATIVAAICARLDGLPLALELAAARLNVLGPEELLARLAQRLPLLTRGSQDLPERQRTLRAALDWSHDLLNPGEQALFRRLAAFTGGAALAAIEAVCAPPAPLAVELLDWLGGLVEHGLVRREYADADAPPRFTMLETVREYAAAQLAAHGDEETTHRRRHADHFLALAEEAAQHLSGTTQARWLALLVADQDNLRAALRWAIDCGDTPIAIRLGAALWRFWHRTDAWTEGRTWLRSILALPAPADDILLSERVTVQRGAGMLAMIQSDFSPAHDHLQAALAIARKAGDERGAARVLDNLAIVAKERGDFHGAVALHEQALATLREVGTPAEVAVVLSNLGGAHDRLCNFRRSAEYTSEALDIYRSLGDTYSALIATINLGIVSRQLGDYARARTLFQEARTLARESGNLLIDATALSELGAIALDQSDPATATNIAREVLELMRPLGHGTRLAVAHTTFGEALRRSGDPAGAAAQAAKARTIAATLADDWSGVAVAILHGALAEDAGDHDAARREYHAALGLARRIDYPLGIAAALIRLGATTPDPSEAATYFRGAHTLSAAMDHPLLGASALEGLAAAAIGEDEPTLAARLLGVAEATRARLGTPREPAWAAFCARTTAAARAALGDTTYTTAHSAGHGWDFAVVAKEPVNALAPATPTTSAAC